MERAAVLTRAQAATQAGERRALRDAATQWALSRVACWVAGIAGVLVLGAHAASHDPLALTSPFGSFGDLLVAPAARWDTVWYVSIADHGYTVAPATQFFPLYPLGARVVGTLFGSSLVGGIVVSLAGLLAALYMLRRLTELELGDLTAHRTIQLLAFFPTAVFFSAVYTEGLFLALTIGSFYSARSGRWALAGIAGGLATITRPTGILLLAPLLLLYLYGPRADRPDLPRGRGIRPRVPLRPNVLWLLAVPAGLAAYLAYLGIEFGDPLVLVGQGTSEWNQTFTFPLVAVARAAARAVDGAAGVFSGHAPDNVYEFGFFVLACVATVGAFRRLPAAYGAYAAVGIAFIVSFPIGGESLSSFSRYMTPLFPILIWLAAWSSERRIYRWVLAVFALLMAVNAARFATWHFVA